MASEYELLRKSDSDDRLYRYFVLPNSLKVLVIQDENTDKGAAAMNVNIGSIHDPPEFPGLAHFCEHMLFLGTAKYPKENDYTAFLSDHGGYSNAFTASHDTNYFFDVGYEHLEGALDRFAQFFHQPLFNQECTDREVNAVNSENEKNLKNDAWRLNQLDKACSNPKHPYVKFSTGNKATLLEEPRSRGLDTREALLQFHSKYYSSNIMGLTVLGRDSLDDLEAMVRSKFSDIENKNVVSPLHEMHPHADAKKILVQAIPVKDVRYLDLSFAIKDQTANFKSQPGHYLSHLLGHEGKGSLLSQLKAKGWVDALSAGAMTGEVGTYGFFKVSLDITKEGLAAIDSVVHTCFQYIAMLKSQPFQPYVFSECKKLYEMAFRFQDKTPPASTCSSLAKNLRLYPPAHVLSAHYDLDVFDPAATQSLLDELNPDNLRLLLVAKEIKDSIPDTEMQTEKYYETLYCKVDFEEAQLALWKSAQPVPEFHYPPQNQFIASDLSILPPPTGVASEVPSLVHDSARLKVWHKQDVTFKLPKGYINICLTSPLALNCPFNACKNRILVNMFKDALNEYSYDATLAGISFNVSSTAYGIDLSVSGYHEKLPAFLGVICKRLATYTLEETRFPMIKDQYRRKLQNFKAAQPLQIASFTLQRILSQRVFTHEQMLDALEPVTAADVQAYVPEFLKRIHLECLVFGNFSRENALSITHQVDLEFASIEGSGSLLPCERELMRLHKLDHATAKYEATTDVQEIGAVVTYMQTGRDNVRSNALLMVLHQLSHEPCFETLRTQEQLGYNVGCQALKLSGVRGLQVYVQSNHDIDYVVERIHSFLFKMDSVLTSMSNEQFEQNIMSLSAKLLEKPKTLQHEMQRYWSEIISHYYVFDRALLADAEIKKFSKSDVVEFFRRFIRPDAPDRKELYVQVKSTRAPAVSPPDVATSSVGTAGFSEGMATVVATTLGGTYAGPLGALLGAAVGGAVAKFAGNKHVPASEPKRTTSNQNAYVIKDIDAFKQGLSLYPQARGQEHVLNAVAAVSTL
eukprot:m.131877 g.131877  ORF g.131877 m.131877 type:complete len:1030 (+) comp17483_c0_seq1:47-3136(+)